MAPRAEELLAQAKALAPLAAHRGEQGVLLAKAQGCRVFDADNVGLVDLTGGGGACLLGYANQYVLDAVRKATTLGVASGFACAQELELAEALSEFLPDYGPWVFTSSETEAFELAIRFCRKRTGRMRLVVFEGNRSGAVEALQVIPGGPVGLSLPKLTGLLPEVVRAVRVVPWGNAEVLGRVLDEVGVDTAAVILDPVASQFGVIPPDPGFLGKVRELTRSAGALLILDETVTGLRLDRGGANQLFGIDADLVVMGGALGGGVSTLGAVAFAKRLEATVGEEVAPPPSPLAMAAATATLSVLRNDAGYQRLEERSVQLAAGIEALAEKFERPLRVNRVGSILALAFSRQGVRDAATAASCDQATYRRFFQAVKENGALLPAKSPSPAFLSLAHGVKDVEAILQAMEVALRKMQKEDEA
ncbi:MAG: aminotransferase class III-fold pyridoxal phosphate-dependent enzyme [Thermoanaerobaculum sp.]